MPLCVTALQTSLSPCPLACTASYSSLLLGSPLLPLLAARNGRLPPHRPRPPTPPASLWHPSHQTHPHMYSSSVFLIFVSCIFSNSPKLSLGGLCRKFRCGETDCKPKQASKQESCPAVGEHRVALRRTGYTGNTGGRVPLVLAVLIGGHTYSRG